MTKKEFNIEVKESVSLAVNRCNAFLRNLDLSLSVNWDYEFEGDYLGDAIGVYEGGSVFNGEISVSCNLKELYRYFSKSVKEYPWSDPYKILDEMISTNIYHEMAHGLIELIESYLHETDELDGIYDANKELFDNVLDNEEESVESFAWAMYDNDLEENNLYRIIELYLNLYNINVREMKIDSKRISEIIREEVNALDFFNNLNQRSGDLTPWDSETKMDRMRPSNASRSKGSIPTNDFRVHTYQDWVQNYKPKGISYQQYREMEI